MLSWWFLSDTHMSWFSSTDPMEGKSDLGEDGCCIPWFEFWKRLSYRGWRSHLYTHYIGPRRIRDTWWRKLLCLWVIGWFLGSIWIFSFMNSQATERRRDTLSSMCDERARMLQDQFNVSMNHVQALSILVNTFHHSKFPSAIDQATFAKYTERTAFERPLTSGVAYAVKVLHSERAEFEKQQGWTIKKMHSKKQDQLPGREGDSFTDQEASAIQEEYAPVIFAQDTVKYIVSFDMLTGKEDRENILRARMSGKGVLTAPFRLQSDRLGVILTFAVYKPELLPNAPPEERIKAAIGYIGGVFDIESLVDKLLHQLACKQSIIVNVYDTTSALEPISMYGSNITANRICHVSSLNFGDPYRKHEMHCRFKNKPPTPWLAITTSIGTLVIALLIGYIFHATVNRIAKVEDDYRQMIELKKRAEDADVAKSQFLATVSHEIRTPINGVLGMLQMLMDTSLDITQQDYVRTAQASGKALVSLINEVLDQAKIESGKLELEAVQFDLRSVLDDVLSLFSGKSQEKGLELAVYVSDRVPEVLIGDPGRIRQIITNLMGNSMKFTEKGHVFVSVHLAEEVLELQEKGTQQNNVDTLSGFPVADKRNSWSYLSIFNKDGTASQSSLSLTPPNLINLVISVEDTGIGIPNEAQSRIFTPFMQVVPSTARIHGGTGIGLSISKCLVGLMRGEIVFASELKVGSTFTFTAALSRGTTKSNGYKPTEFCGMTALIVDGKSVRAMVTKYHLQRLGIAVETVADSEKALPLIKSGQGALNMVLIDREVWFADATLWAPFVGKEEVDRKGSPKIFLLTNPSSSTKINASESMGVVPTVIMKPLRATMLAVSIQRTMGVGEKENGRHETLPLSSLRRLLRGRCILVVDDNLVNLRVAAGALKKYGAEVATADSGKKAIDMLKPPHEFDACFMDIQMPEMDGFQATKAIRENEGIANKHINSSDASIGAHKNITHWHVPILAMTADVIQATHEECLKCGMDGYVSKPFEGEQLYREVVRFLVPTSKKTQ